MSASQALRLIIQAIFLLVAPVVRRDAMRHPRRTTSDITFHVVSPSILQLPGTLLPARSTAMAAEDTSTMNMEHAQ